MGKENQKIMTGKQTKKKTDVMDRLHGMVLHREIAARADAVDAKTRIAQLTFSSETPVERWFGQEILCHDKDDIDLSRLSSIGVLLFNHDPDDVIGKIISVSIGDDKRGHAEVQFDTDEASDKVFQKVLSGTLKGVSVGYQITRLETVEEGEKSSNGRFDGPVEVATKWIPLEISIVSVPADPGVGVGRSLKQIFKGDNEMGEKNKNVLDSQNVPKNNEPARGISSTANPVNLDTEAIRAEAIKAERERVADITSLCRSFDLLPDAYIKDNKSVEEVRRLVLKDLAEKKKAMSMTVGKDETDKYREAASDGLSIRAGVKVEKPAAGFEEFRGMSLMRLAANIYERENGKSASHMEDEALIRSVFGGGTGAFTTILANVGHKSMLQTYQEVPTTYQNWTAVGSNSDFKPASRVGLGEVDGLVEMTENGEFKNAEATDYGVTTQIHTFGRSYAITRKAIINDDLGALTALPAKYGAAARRMINQMAYKELTTGKLFSKDNGNIGTEAISINGIAAGKIAMAKQKDPSKKAFLNLQPVYIIVPPELEVTAAQLISSVVDPTKNNAVPNPFANKLTVISDPTLTDAKTWYMVAAPGVTPGIEVTYLNGVQTPTMETQVDFNTLGIKHRIYLDFGINPIDYRAFYRSTFA